MKKKYLALLFLSACLMAVPAQAKVKVPVAPERLQADCVNQNTIRLRWRKVANASGYTIYRAKGEKGKYKRIAKIKATSSSWRKYYDKKCKKDKVYRYKVKANRTIRKKNRFGQASYSVMALAHGKNAKKVNPWKLVLRTKVIDPGDDKGNMDIIRWATEIQKEVQICQKYSLKPKIDTKGYKKAFNKKISYSVSDPSFATVSPEGLVTVKDKEGTFKITARTCNGKQFSQTVQVIDYTKLDHLSSYDGSSDEVNELFRNYKEDLRQITHYFVTHNQGSTSGKIHIDSNNAIVGYPNFPDNDSIKENAEHILRNYPRVDAIYYSGKMVSFNFHEKYGEYSLDYRIDETSKRYGGWMRYDKKIGPHWVIYTSVLCGTDILQREQWEKEHASTEEKAAETTTAAEGSTGVPENSK